MSKTPQKNENISIIVDLEDLNMVVSPTYPPRPPSPSKPPSPPTKRRHVPPNRITVASA